MPLWCEKCQTRIYDNKCSKCGHVHEDTSKSYNLPKYKKTRIVQGIKENKKIISKNILLAIPIIIIAISISYLAFSKYKENREIEEVSKIFFGTSDTEEIKSILKKQSNDLNTQLTNAKNTMDKELNKIHQNTQKKIKEIINQPIPKFEPIKFKPHKPQKSSWQIAKERKEKEEKRKRYMLKEEHKKAKSNLNLQLNQAINDMN